MPEAAFPRPNALRRRDCLAALGAALALGGCASRGSRESAGLVPPLVPGNPVAAFSSCERTGELPPGWEPYVLRRDLPRTDYRIGDRSGERALFAGGRGVSSGLRCNVQLPMTASPRVRWRWLAEQVPAGMNCGDDDTDDAPARVGIGFDGDLADLAFRQRAFYDLVELVTGQRLPFATLMYVWDAQLPVGTVVNNARTDRIRYLVVDSGPAGAGRWRAHERDIAADYRRVFQEPLPRTISSVGLVTDSDDLKVDVSTWYGDITLHAA